MKIETKYPLLLTTVEPQYLKHHYEDERTSSDVYQAVYLQGEHLKDDQVVNWRPVATVKNLDERGLGWKDTRSCWISQNEQSWLVTPDAEPSPVELPSGLPSASGRYLWTVEQSAQESTRLRQLDRHTGQSSTVWEHDGWAGLSLASDPSRDRLIWACSGYHLKSPLQSWNPARDQNEVVTTPFQSDFSHLKFSPDGSSLAFVHDRQVCCLRDGQTHRISGPPCNTFNYRLHPCWSPDSKRLFYCNAHFDIQDDVMRESYQWMAALPDGSARRVLRSSPAVAQVQVGPAFS